MIPTSNHNKAVICNKINTLYIFWFLHQTTTLAKSGSTLTCCISFDSYIKPQLDGTQVIGLEVVYLLIPTSNHNRLALHPILRLVVYLLIPTSNHNSDLRQSFDKLVVYLLIPTSNHNADLSIAPTITLYIFWFLHQTTTSVAVGHKSPKLYIFWFLHQTTTAW